MAERQGTHGRAFGEPSTLSAPASRYVHRDRLDEALEQLRCGDRTIITVWSAAGSGKTTLLTSWARRLVEDGRDVHWVTAQKLAASPNAIGAAVLAASGGATITGSGPSGIVVVDDIHALTSASTSAITTLLEDLPPEVGIVLAGRYQPFPSLTFMQATGLICELRAADLAFTPSEAVDLASRHGFALEPDLAETLVRRTGGWATALALAVPWLRDSTGAREAVARFDGDHRAVADYLIAEVLGGLSAEEQDVLMRTAIRDVVPADLAIALADRPDTGQLLRGLAERNALLAEEPGGYRFHPVLSSYLQAECRRRDADAFSEAHVRASQWFAEQSDNVRALEEAIASRRPEVLRSALEGFGLELMLSGETDIILRAAGLLPSDTTSLAALGAQLLLEAPDFADARRATHLFSAALRDDRQAAAGDDPGGLWFAVIVALHCLSHNEEAALADRLKRLLSDDIAAQRRRSLALDLLATTAEAWCTGVNGEPERAQELFHDVATSSHHAGYAWLFLVSNELAARIAARAGQWDRAVTFENQLSAEVLGDERPLRDRVRVAAVIAAAGRAYRRCELLPIARLNEIVSADPFGTRFGLVVPAQVVAQLPALDSDDNPRRTVDTLEALLRDYGSQYQRLFAIASLRMVSLRLSLDGRGPAKELAEVACLAVGEDSLESETVRFALAFPSRVGELAEDQLIEALRRKAAAWHPGAPISAWILLASAAEQTGRHAEAGTRILTALRLSKRTGSIQPFAARSGEGARLLESRIGRLGHLDAYARTVRDRVRSVLPKTQAVRSGMESLTPREHEILNELPLHQSVAEIASKQTLSINTVKTHLRSIYQKLGVSDRSEAVLAAHEHGLL